MGALYGFLTGVATGAGATLAVVLAWPGRSGLSLAQAVTPGGIQTTARLDDQMRAMKMQRDLAERRLAERETELARLRHELARARGLTDPQHLAELVAPLRAAGGSAIEQARVATAVRGFTATADPAARAAAERVLTALAAGPVDGAALDRLLAPPPVPAPAPTDD